MSSSLVVGISELRRENAAPKPVSVSEIVDWSLEFSRIDSTRPIEADLRVIPIAGGFLVEGDVEAGVRHTCSRCLDEWGEDLTVPVSQLVVDGDEDADADYSVDGVELDLEPILRDEILLALPLRPTCGSDCKGVVDAAKTGLNTGIPDDEGGTDSPFAVLRDLFDRGG